MLSGEAGGIESPAYEQVLISDKQARPLQPENRFSSYALKRESGLMASVKELQRREEAARANQEIVGNSMSRSRS